MKKRGCLGVGIVLLAVCLAASGFQPAAAPGDEYEYVGTKTCKKCHYDHWQSWSQTKMANSMVVLWPDSRLKPNKKLGLTEDWITEIKQNKTKGHPKIDPAKDYSQDADCLKCHTTGYGHKGGYKLADKKDKKAIRKNKDLEGVGCESCHGPGSKYIKIFKEIQDKQRPYTREELYAAGMTPISADVCAKCHNKESPLVDDNYVFDFEKRKVEGTHKHIELKLRKE